MTEDQGYRRPGGIFRAAKRLFLVSLLVVSGLLLTLAGLNLISITSNLQLYSGVGLLVLALIYYFIY